jgi:hypothetical protein
MTVRTKVALEERVISLATTRSASLVSRESTWVSAFTP